MKKNVGETKGFTKSHRSKVCKNYVLYHILAGLQMHATTSGEQLCQKDGFALGEFIK